MKKMNIVFVEPNEIEREGLSLFFGTFKNVNTVEKFKFFSDVVNIDFKNIDLIVFDTAKDLDFEIVKLLKGKYPALRFLLLSSKERFFDNYFFAEKFQLDSFLTKQITPEDLKKELEKIQCRINNGIIPMDKPNKKLFEAFFDATPSYSFRELCVLHLLAKGKTTVDMAKIMGLSKRTIESHRRRIVNRTETKNIVTSLLIAIQKRYISVDFL